MSAHFSALIIRFESRHIVKKNNDFLLLRLCLPFLCRWWIVMARSVWTNNSLTWTNRPDSLFQFVSFGSFVLPDSTPARPTGGWVGRTRTSPCVHWPCLVVKPRGLSNNILIPNMKRSSAKRNSVNVVLTDDRSHHFTIVVRLNENEGGAESDWNANERTNKRTNDSS